MRSRRMRLGVRLALAGVVGIAFFGASALADEEPVRPPGLGDVTEVRTWAHPEYTRVVVELNREVSTEVKRLPANEEAGRPERLYFDLDGIWVGRQYSEGIPLGDGLLEGVRLGQNERRKSRVVVDLARYERHRLLRLRSPDRIVLDVFGARDGLETSTWPRPPGADADGRLPMVFRPIRRVVVDPGHGGRDPGATGVGGLREKDVNLRMAKRLAKHLDALGFEVVLTRTDDRYLDLVERTALAEKAEGDLFISLHANASPRRKTRGIEIYHLDKSHKRHTLEVAARENDVALRDVDALQREVARLRVAEAGDHSHRLARCVHDAVFPKLAKKHRGLADLGVKKGPFHVLFLSTMPSILVETGFLTNKYDARLLRSEDYIDRMAKQIALGLDRYREEAPTLVAGARP